MEMKVTVSGCPYEDREALAIFSRSMELYGVLSDVREVVRSRLKWEDITEEEAEFLDQLRSDLYVEGLD